MKTTISILILYFFFLASCTRKEEVDTPEDTISDAIKLTAEQIKNANITTGPLIEETIATSIHVSGRLEAPPQNIVTISSPFAGFIKTIDLLQGVAVKKGQVVVVLQHPDFILPQQNYLEQKNELEFLETEYSRQEELAKDNINAQKTFQLAKSNYLVAKAKLDGLRGRLILMNLNLTQIESGEFTSMIKLYAPFDGNVTEINVNLGQFVNPNDAIVKIVDTKHLHVEIKAFEKDVFKIKPGQAIQFILNGDTQKRKASVYLIGKEISADRTITIHGHLEKEDSQLLPGMFLTAEIQSNEVLVKTLPEAAVVSYDGNSFIFKEEESGRYKMIEVTTGTVKENRIEVILPDDTMANSKFVLTGAYSLLSVLKNQPEE